MKTAHKIHLMGINLYVEAPLHALMTNPNQLALYGAMRCPASPGCKMGDVALLLLGHHMARLSTTSCRMWDL